MGLKTDLILFDKGYPSKRWGIEVKFDELKSRLRLQNLTGDTVIVVEQDFSASVLGVKPHNKFLA